MNSCERLYYTRPELCASEAEVLSIESRPDALALELDATLFYPEGGGQPCDLGSIDGFPLLAVEERGGSILHLLGPEAKTAFAPGKKAALLLDSRRRLDHAQQHTAQHLLSSIMFTRFDAPTISFHLGAEHCTIDVDRPLVAAEVLREAELAVEEHIAKDLPIVTHRCPPENIDAFPLRRKPPTQEGELRVVEIGGIDFTPCCGTHLASTGAIRHLKILGAEKYKGMTRLSFVAGARAIGRSFSDSLAAGSVARAFGCSIGQIDEKAARAVALLKELERSAAFLERERALLTARLESTKPGGLPGFVSTRYEDRGAAAAQEAVNAFAGLGAAALVASLPELTVIAALPESRGGQQGLGPLLKPLLQEAGGKGGGGARSFRASFADAASLETFFESAATAMRRASAESSKA